MGGLNRDIIDRLEVIHYENLEELFYKAVMFEKQIKRRSAKPSYNSSKPSYQREEKSGFQKEYTPFVKPKVEEISSKGKEKEVTRTRDLKYFKCHGLGHYASECSNKRIMIIRDSGEVESEDEKPEESDVEEAPKGALLVTMRVLSVRHTLLKKLILGMHADSWNLESTHHHLFSLAMISNYATRRTPISCTHI